MTKGRVLGGVALLMGVLLVQTAIAADKDAIKKQVDEVVVAIDGGKKAADFADTAKRDPYVFIIEKAGPVLVHPTLVGQSMKEKAPPVYDAIGKATPAGVWVDYDWQGKKKHTYVREAKGGLIVGSGYSD